MNVLTSNAPRRARGLSLIELMVALTIGTLLMLGLVEVFTASRTAYQLATAVGRAQENGRFALDFLTRDIRMAGHAGCVNDQSLMLPDGGNINSLFLTTAQRDANTVTALNYRLRFDVAIQGYEAKGTAPSETFAIPTTLVTGAASDWDPALPTDLAALNPLKGSDIIIMRFMSAEGAPMVQFTPGTSSKIKFPAANEKFFTEGRGLFAISDCQRASVFQITAAPNTADNEITVGIAGLNKSNFGQSKYQELYKPGQTMLYRAESLAYYVGLNATTNEPVLRRVRWGLTPTGGWTQTVDELVEGVESMQLLYASDREQTKLPTGYMAATTTADKLGDLTNAAKWRRVGAVQVGFLTRSAGERASSPKAQISPRVLDTAFTVPDDRRYRSPYQTTVALRNRLFGN